MLNKVILLVFAAMLVSVSAFADSAWDDDSWSDDVVDDTAPVSVDDDTDIVADDTEGDDAANDDAAGDDTQAKKDSDDDDDNGGCSVSTGKTSAALPLFMLGVGLFAFVLHMRSSRSKSK